MLLARRIGAVVPFIGFVAALLTGCANIKTVMTRTEEEEPPERTQSVVAQSRRVQAQGRVLGTDLVVDLTSEETCEIVEVPIIHRFEHDARTFEPFVPYQSWPPSATLPIGGGLLGLGAFSYLGAEGLAAKPDSNGNRSAPDDFRALGLVLGGAGVIVAAVATIDLIRGMDSDRDLGVVRLEPTKSQRPCHRRALWLEDVRLAVGRKAFAATTSEDGRVRFSMLEIAEPDLMAGSIKVTGAEFSVPAELDRAELVSLLEELAANGESRISQDREAAAQKLCSEQIARVRDRLLTSATDEAEAKQSWRDTKDRCATWWSTDDQIAMDSALAWISQSEARRAHANCSEALTDILTAIQQDKPETVHQEHGRAERLCSSSDSDRERLTGISKQVAAFDAQVARERAANDALDAARGLLAQGDPKAAWQRVGHDQALLRRLREDAGFEERVFKNAAGHASRLLAKIGTEEDRLQLCFSRLIIFRTYGQQSWGEFVRKVAQEAGAKDPLFASRAIRVLNDGKCR